MRIKREANGKVSRYKIAVGLGIFLATLVILFLFLQLKTTSQVLLDISYRSNNKTLGDHTESTWQLIADTDKISVLQLSKNLEMTVEPHLKDENKRIDVMTYKIVNGKREPIGMLQPVSLIDFDEPFVVEHQTSDPNMSAEFEITIVVLKN